MDQEIEKIARANRKVVRLVRLEDKIRRETSTQLPLDAYFVSERKERG